MITRRSFLKFLGVMAGAGALPSATAEHLAKDFHPTDKVVGIDFGSDEEIHGVVLELQTNGKWAKVGELLSISHPVPSFGIIYDSPSAYREKVSALNPELQLDLLGSKVKKEF